MRRYLLAAVALGVLGGAFGWMFMSDRGVHREADSAEIKDRESETAQAWSHLDRSGANDDGGAPVLEPATRYDDRRVALKVEWRGKVLTDLPLPDILLENDRGESSGRAELTSDSLIFEPLPAGLYVARDDQSRVIFAGHEIRSDGNGNHVLGATRDGTLVVAAAVPVAIRVVTDAGENGTVSVGWHSGPKGSGLEGFSDVVSAPFNGQSDWFSVPAMELFFVLGGKSEYALVPRVHRDLPFAHKVIELRVVRQGVLLAYVRERNPGDFTKEVARHWKQARGLSAGVKYATDGKLQQELSTSVKCDAEKLARIGSGIEPIQIPYRAVTETTQAHVWIRCMSGIVASAYTTLLPNSGEQTVWLDAVSRDWNVRVHVTDEKDSPVAGVTVELGIGVYTDREARSSASIGEPDQTAVTDAVGVAHFSDLPLVEGGYFELRVGSGHRRLAKSVLDAQSFFDIPREPETTDVRIQVQPQLDVLRVVLAPPPGSPAESIGKFVKYAVHGTNVVGGTLTWDGQAEPADDGSFNIADVPPGKYTVIVTGGFGVASASGRVDANNRTIRVEIDPRLVEGFLQHDGKPLAGAVIIAAALDPTVVWAVGSQAGGGMISVGQRTTDDNGWFSLRHSGAHELTEWTCFHAQIGVFRLQQAGQDGEGKSLYDVADIVPGGTLMIAFDAAGVGDSTPFAVYVTPVISEEKQRVVMDFAWGVSVPVDGSELKLERMPAGRYQVMVATRSPDGSASLAISREWRNVAVMTAGETTRLTFPR